MVFSLVVRPVRLRSKTGTFFLAFYPQKLQAFWDYGFYKVAIKRYRRNNKLLLITYKTRNACFYSPKTVVMAKLSPTDFALSCFYYISLACKCKSCAMAANACKASCTRSRGTQYAARTWLGAPNVAASTNNNPYCNARRLNSLPLPTGERSNK